MPKIIEPWVTGDGGPAIVLPESQVLRWRGALDFEKSLMAGGDLETHYDIACRCTEWASPFEADGIRGLCLAGDEMPVAWFFHDQRCVLIRPIFSDSISASDDVPEQFIAESTMVSKVVFEDDLGRFRLLMASDSGPQFIYNTSSFGGDYQVRLIETREFCDDRNHIVFHRFLPAD